MKKKCTTCKRTKRVGLFHKSSKSCKRCMRLYYLAHREERIRYQREYYETNKAQIMPKAIERTRAWQKANPDRHRKNARESFHRRYHGDLAFRAKVLERCARYRARKRAERKAAG